MPSVEYRMYSCPVIENWTFQYDINSPLIGVYETMHDVVTPNFDKRKAKGEVFFNPLNYTKTSFSDSSGTGVMLRSRSLDYCSVGQRYDLTEIRVEEPMIGSVVMDTSRLYPQYTALSNSELSALAVEVSTRCLASRGRSDSNLFESLAQWRQTVSMFKKPLLSYDKFLKKNWYHFLKGGSEAWLTYRYGFLPLYNDIRAILAGVEKEVGSIRKTSRASGSTSANRIVLGSTTTQPLSTVVNWQCTVTDTVEMRAMSLDEYIVTLNSNIGFGYKELITVPWELVPYSFVADWFANVGDYLGALVPLPGFKQLGSCLVTSRKLENVFSAVSTTNSSYDVLRPVSGECSATYETKTRTALGKAGLVVKNDFRLDDMVRIADALSLLRLRTDELWKTKKRKRA